MAESLVEVKILGLVPSSSGIAVFLGNDEKAFSIHVDGGVGTNIALILQGNKRERPLTHDLIGLIFKAFSISVERVVINDLRNDTYYARLTLKMENEVHTRITEIDARPSDCLAIALEAGKKVFVAPKVWNEVVDISATLEEMKEKMEHSDIDDLFGGANDEEDDDDEDSDDEDEDDQESGKS
ncbi:MAG: bifunctional nuclease family protein [Verrucomicrobiales bacterium]|jgi:bifunctional DNase/RNase|nr:bifunctional nuclease family protein [Verrucomicrobiales bacterium]